MTVCRKCGVDKDPSEYYKSDPNNCKECIKSRVRKHRQDNIERVREYDRNRPNHKFKKLFNQEPMLIGTQCVW